MIRALSFAISFLLITAAWGQSSTHPENPDEDLKLLPKHAEVVFHNSFNISAKETMEPLDCSPGDLTDMPIDIHVLVQPHKRMRQISPGKRFKVRDSFIRKLDDGNIEYVVLELKPKKLHVRIKYQGGMDAVKTIKELNKICENQFQIEIVKVKEI